MKNLKNSLILATLVGCMIAAAVYEAGLRRFVREGFIYSYDLSIPYDCGKESIYLAIAHGGE